MDHATTRSSDMGAFRTRLVTSVSDVPEGFVQIGKFTKDQTERMWLSRAHIAGKIQAVKLARYADEKCGNVFVNERQAVAVVAAKKERQASRVARRAVALAPLMPVAPAAGGGEDLPLLVSNLTAAVRDLQAAVELLAERQAHGVPQVPA